MQTKKAAIRPTGGDFSLSCEKFLKGFRWSLFGSIMFESSHIAQNALLLYFFGSHLYGLLGSLFSIMYLVINLVDLGFESSFAPFLHLVTQNKKSFRQALPAYVLPQLVLLSVGALVALSFYQTLFSHPNQSLPTTFFFVVILLEGTRIFFRRFLHNIFFNKSTVLIEQVFAFLYYAAIWIPYLLGRPLSFSLIFIPYFFNSLFVLTLFLYMTVSFYKKLPEDERGLPSGFWRRVLRTRYFNSLINIELFLISGNFLVPFFATNFGLHQAGLFKIASIVAHSVKALVKSIIHFPGSALLASLRTKSIELKKQAFYMLSKKLNQTIAVTTIILLIAYKSYTFFYPASPLLQFAWLYAFIFIGITLLHQLFVVYEQFYIIEECSSKLFFIKSIEFILFYLLIIANDHLTPLVTLVNIGLIQLLCFALLSTHAYARWRLKPYFGLRNYRGHTLKKH